MSEETETTIEEQVVEELVETSDSADISEADIKAFMEAEGDYDFQAKKEKDSALPKEKETEVKADTSIKNQYADLEEKINRLSEIMKSRSEPPKEEKKEEDPNAHINYEDYPLEFLRLKLEALEKAQSQFNKEYSERQEKASLFEKGRALTNEFISKTPDYADAYNHLWAAKLKEYELFGYSSEDAKKMVEQDADWIVSTSLQKGRNPAEMVYGLAKNSGYVAAQQKSTAKDLLKGKDKAKSLSSIGQGVPSGEEDSPLEKILLIDDPKEFRKAMAAYEKKYS